MSRSKKTSPIAEQEAWLAREFGTDPAAYAAGAEQVAQHLEATLGKALKTVRGRAALRRAGFAVPEQRPRQTKTPLSSQIGAPPSAATPRNPVKAHPSRTAA